MEWHTGAIAGGSPATETMTRIRRWNRIWIWTLGGIAAAALLAIIAVLVAALAGADSNARFPQIDAMLAMIAFGIAAGVVATGCMSFRGGVRQDTMVIVGTFLGIGLLSLAFILLDDKLSGAPVAVLSHTTFHCAMGLLAAAGVFIAVRLASPIPLADTMQHLAGLGFGATSAAVIAGLAFAASSRPGAIPGLLTIGAFSALVVILYGLAAARLYSTLRRQPAVDTACLLLASLTGILAELLFGLAAVFRETLDPVAHAYRVVAFALLYAAVFYQSARRSYPQPQPEQMAVAGSEGRFRSLLELSSDWYWETDEQHRFTVVQGWASPVFGAPLEHYIGRRRWDFPVHNMSEQDWDAHRAALDAHQPFQDLILKTQNWAEETRWVSVYGWPVVDEQGRFRGYCGIGRDVTDLRTAEEALDKEREMLAQAQKLARLGRWEWNLADDSMWASDEVLRMFEIAPRDSGLTRDDFMRCIFHDDREKVLAAVAAALQRDVPYSIAYRVFRADGTARTVHSEAQLFRDDRREPIRFLGTSQDISVRVAAEQAMRESEARIRSLNAELERRVEERTLQLAAANKELEAFSYSVSHDLQAPLRRIERYAELLLETNGGRLDDSGRDMLKRVLGASTHTKRLIEDMLKLAKVSRADLGFAKTDLSAMAHDLIEQLAAHSVPPRNVEVAIEDSIDVHADPAMLRILLDNLLGNAWKFTGKSERARIVVGQRTNAVGSGFFVQDNGAGFDMRYAQKLFGAFQRLHGQDEFQGSGIGLAIVQRIVNLHGWRIEAAAELGKGATFTVWTR